MSKGKKWRKAKAPDKNSNVKRQHAQPSDVNRGQTVGNGQTTIVGGPVGMGSHNPSPSQNSGAFSHPVVAGLFLLVLQVLAGWLWQTPFKAALILTIATFLVVFWRLRTRRVAYRTAVSIAISGFLWTFAALAPSHPTAATLADHPIVVQMPPQPPPQGESVKLEMPTFRQQPRKVTFTLGWLPMIYNPEQVNKEPHIPFDFMGFKPFRFYVENNRPYADVTLYAGPGRPPVELKHNLLLNKPPRWDMNSNQTAMEVVNEAQVPVFQLIYKDEANILINGIFQSPSNTVVVNDRRWINGANAKQIEENRIKRLFRYPAWKYRGEYEEK